MSFLVTVLLTPTNTQVTSHACMIGSCPCHSSIRSVLIAGFKSLSHGMQACLRLLAALARKRLAERPCLLFDSPAHSQPSLSFWSFRTFYDFDPTADHGNPLNTVPPRSTMGMALATPWPSQNSNMPQKRRLNSSRCTEHLGTQPRFALLERHTGWGLQQLRHVFNVSKDDIAA